MTTNHHVGQGGWSLYVLKVAREIGEGYTTDNMKSVIHTAGHWMETYQDLKYFVIYLPVLMKYVVTNPIPPVIADDFVLRQTYALLGWPGSASWKQPSSSPRPHRSGTCASTSMWWRT